VEVAPKTINIVAVRPNHYTTRSTPFEWQTDPFIKTGVSVVTSISEVWNHVVKVFVPFHICLQLQIFRKIDTNFAKIDWAVFDLSLLLCFTTRWHSHW